MTKASKGRKKSVSPECSVPITLLEATKQALALASQGVLSIHDLFITAQRLTEANHSDIAIQLYKLWLEQPESSFAFAAHFNLGVILSGVNDHAGAEAEYRASIKQKPTFAEAYLNLGSLLERTHRPDKALDMWRQVHQIINLNAPSESELFLLAQNNLKRLSEILNKLPNEVPLANQRNHAKPSFAKALSTVHVQRERLRHFDALSADIIFVLWLGPYLMSPARAAAVQSIFRESGRPVCFITDSTLQEWEHPDHPFHPALRYLSEVHRADYLRCYLLHYYGGGYTDIKPVLQPWGKHFTALNESDSLALGYPEISASAVAQLPGELGEQLRTHYAELIGYCSMIFRRRSQLTSEWLAATHYKLDTLLPALQAHPAQHPMDQLGITLPNGIVSEYPLRWTELGGNIFHPLMFKYHQRVIKSAGIMPQLHDYR